MWNQVLNRGWGHRGWENGKIPTWFISPSSNIWGKLLQKVPAGKYILKLFIIIKSTRLEEMSKVHSAQPFVGRGAKRGSCRNLPSHIWKTSRDGDSAMTMQRLFQGMIILTVKTFSYTGMKPFLVWIVHFPFPSPRGSSCRDNLSSLYLPRNSYWNNVMRFSLGLLFSRGEISFCHSSEVRSWHCFGASPVFLCLSWAVGTRAGHTLITTLWVQPFSWFPSHLADHPPSLYLASLSHRCSLSNL